jgi:hypothetical protein
VQLLGRSGLIGLIGLVMLSRGLRLGVAGCGAHMHLTCTSISIAIRKNWHPFARRKTATSAAVCRTGASRFANQTHKGHWYLVSLY